MQDGCTISDVDVGDVAREDEVYLWRILAAEQARRDRHPDQPSHKVLARVLEELRREGEPDALQQWKDTAVEVAACPPPPSIDGPLDPSSPDGRLVRSLWHALMHGELGTACDLAVAAQRGWRSASMSGSLSEWASACLAVASDTSALPMERALYGVLGGDASYAVSNLTSFWDQLWASARSGSSIVPEAQHLEEEVVALYLAGKEAELAERLRTAVAATDDVRVWRMAANLAIFLAGKVSSDAAGGGGALSDVLSMYVRHLAVEVRDARAAAVYAARFEAEADRVQAYSQYLSSLSTEQDQLTALVEAERAGLGIGALVRFVADSLGADEETLRAEVRTVFEAEPHPVERQADEARWVRSIEWLTYDKLQAGAALCRANAALRRFVARKQLSSVRRIIMEVLPRSIVDDVAAMADSSSVRARAIREYECYYVWLVAVDSLDAWRADPTSVDVGALSSCLLGVLEFPHGWLIDTVEVEAGDVGTAELVDTPAERETLLQSARQAVIVDFVHALRDVLLASGQTEKFLDLADIVADPRLHLVDCFSKQQLRDLLQTIGEASLKHVTHFFP